MPVGRVLGAIAKYLWSRDDARLAIGSITDGEYLKRSGDTIISAAVSGGVSDHTGLSNLVWTASAHTGDASKLAGFTGAGAAAYYAIGSGGVQAYHDNLAAVAGLTFAAGDLIQGTGAGTIAVLASVATGNVLISGGVTTVSSWGKVGLTTHVSGTLPVANGGTGIASWTTGAIVHATGATTLAGLDPTAQIGTVLMSAGTGAAPAYGTNVWRTNWVKQSWTTAVANTFETNIPATNGDYVIILTMWVEATAGGALRRVTHWIIGLRRAAGTLALLGTSPTNEMGNVGGGAPSIAIGVSGDDITITYTSAGRSGSLAAVLRVGTPGDMLV